MNLQTINASRKSALFLRAASAVLAVVCLTCLPGCGSTHSYREDVQSIAKLDSLGLAQDSQSNLYLIRKGDQVKILSLELPEIDTTVTVNEDGLITLRLVGPMQVIGMTRSDVVHLLSEKLTKYVRSPFQLVVSVSNSSVQTMTILGAVEHQGNFPIQADMTLLQALATAGGSTAESDLRHIKVYRRGEYAHPLEADVAENVASDKPADLPVVKPGDTVIVPREENVIRELSNFFRDVIFLFSLFALAK